MFSVQPEKPSLVCDKLPFPRPSIIAARLGVSTRTVQRAFRKLEASGYVQDEEVKAPDGSHVKAFTLQGLVEKLKQLANADPVLSARIAGFKIAKGIDLDGSD